MCKYFFLLRCRPNFASMLFADAEIIRLESVDSTNNYAANLLKLSRVPEGTVITAQEQTEGRGQRGTVWKSEKRANLLSSIILYPLFLSPENQFLLSKAVSLAVRELIEDLTEREVFVKWPNDIIVHDKKIAGILIETSISANKIQSAVVGIGVNLNQTELHEPHATSIAQICSVSQDLEQSLKMLIAKLEKYYFRLAKGYTAEINEDYLSHLYGYGLEKEYIYQGQKLRARITGIESSGRLRLETERNAILTCDFKEIALVW